MGPVLDLVRFYHQDVVDAGKLAQLLFLAAFVVAFAVVRAITHAIRSQRIRWLRNIEVGDTHVHHLVPGIGLLLLTGYLALAFGFWPSRNVLAVLFGVGAALTLDEFALWLHLEDVYWTPQGRRSVDVVTAAAVFAALMVLGVGFWIELAKAVEIVADATLAVLASISLVLAAVCLVKGRLVTGVVAIFVPLVGLVGAVRPAKPSSPWARATATVRASLER